MSVKNKDGSIKESVANDCAKEIITLMAYLGVGGTHRITSKQAVANALRKIGRYKKLPDEDLLDLIDACHDRSFFFYKIVISTYHVLVQ